MLIYMQTTCGQQPRPHTAVGISAETKSPSHAPSHPRSLVITPARVHSPHLATYSLSAKITTKICSLSPAKEYTGWLGPVCVVTHAQ